MKNTNEVMHYIRKNRQTTAMIYLGENDNKAAQKLFCMAYAMDCNYEVLGETTNLGEVKDCNLMLIASESVMSVIAKDKKEYEKIVKQLKKKSIEVEVALGNSAGKYIDMSIDMALELYRKGRI